MACCPSGEQYGYEDSRFKKMSTRIFIVLSATTFSKNQGRVEIMITSFVLPASVNI